MPVRAQAAATGALHVEGKRLVGPAGESVVLHGVNRSGTESACVNGWGIFDGPSDAPPIATPSPRTFVS